MANGQGCPCCGYKPQPGEKITIHTCGYCGKVVKHQGPGDGSCKSYEQCSEGRGTNHYNLQKAGEIKG